jgi:hypothetical protein
VLKVGLFCRRDQHLPLLPPLPLLLLLLALMVRKDLRFLTLDTRGEMTRPPACLR